MNQISFVTLTHAKTGHEIFLLPHQPYYIEKEAKAGETHVISQFGAILPVKESVDEVKRRIKAAIEGDENG